MLGLGLGLGLGICFPVLVPLHSSWEMAARVGYVARGGDLHARQSVWSRGILTTLADFAWSVINHVSFFFQTLLSNDAAASYVAKGRSRSTAAPSSSFGGPGGPGGGGGGPYRRHGGGIHGMGSLQNKAGSPPMAGGG